MGDRYRGRSRSPQRSRESPPPQRRSDSRAPERGRSDRAPQNSDRVASKPAIAQGHYKVTVEDIPADMSWTELKDLGRESGRTLTFARTYKTGSRYCGMIEFKDKADADAAVTDLNNRRVQGSKDRLHVFHGDAAGKGDQGKYKGNGQYEGRGRDDHQRDDRRDDRDVRRSRSPPPRSPPRGRDNSPGRSPPRQRSPQQRSPQRRSPRRSPPRRSPPRRGGGDEEEIMTLFVKDLPEDARESEVQDDIGRIARVLRVMLMRKNGQCSAFVRFETVRDAERAMDDMADGKARICGTRVHAEKARRNTGT